MTPGDHTVASRETTRRTFLTGSLGVGVGSALAGCSTGTDGTDTPTGTPDQLYALTGSYEIPAGAFRDLALDIDDPAVIDYTADVRSGPNIDVLTLGVPPPETTQISCASTSVVMTSAYASNRCGLSSGTSTLPPMNRTRRIMLDCRAAALQ
jgi:hypothetical protein